MLKILLKKQFEEAFKSYFYDAKNNKMRSKASVIGWFIFFIVIMVGVLGGFFTRAAISICEPLVANSVGWLYFVLMSGLAILIGAFGSIFSTYTSLYLGKDNDLLLSLPIPVRTVIIARLLNVYLMGTMYSLLGTIPMILVYLFTIGATGGQVLCWILLAITITLIVMILSCLLGYVVARISVKLKHRSIFSALFAVIGIVIYYICYFRASRIVGDIIANAKIYADKIKGAAKFIYLFGQIGEGNLMSAVVYTALCAAIMVILLYVISRSFLRIATTPMTSSKTTYVEKRAKMQSLPQALLIKELLHFVSSANYMLNCGLGIFMIPAAGIFMLIKGHSAFEVADEIFVSSPGAMPVIVCVGLCMMTSMIDTAVPSVSLEGKSVWLSQALPIPTKKVLHAKINMQFLLSVVPITFAGICVAIISGEGFLINLLILVTAVIFAGFASTFGMIMGLKMPVMNWTNEVAPIKQNFAVMIAIMGSWFAGVAMFLIYMFVGFVIGPAVYLAIWASVLLVIVLLQMRWIDTRGCEIYRNL